MNFSTALKKKTKKARNDTTAQGKQAEKPPPLKTQKMAQESEKDIGKKTGICRNLIEYKLHGYPSGFHMCSGYVVSNLSILGTFRH